MSRKTLIFAAIAMVALPAAVQAQSRTTAPTRDQPGASEYAPGQQNRSGTHPGASGSAPGQRGKNSAQDAKDFAPGQRMNDTTGSTSGMGARSPTGSTSGTRR